MRPNESVDELFDEVRKDEAYYRASGGGVTIGGGEATAQPTFTLQLIRKCRDNYIHTALDTCGYITTADGLRALDEADLALYDLKGMDPIEHRKYTGVSNKVIHDNLRRRDSLGKPTIIRLPLIPGYTDSAKNLRETAEFLATLRWVERVDLLPVHEFGKVKYEQLGQEYRPGPFAPITRECLDEVRALFADHGLVTQIGG